MRMFWEEKFMSFSNLIPTGGKSQYRSQVEQMKLNFARLNDVGRGTIINSRKFAVISILWQKHTTICVLTTCEFNGEAAAATALISWWDLRLIIVWGPVDLMKIIIIIIFKTRWPGEGRHVDQGESGTDDKVGSTCLTTNCQPHHPSADCWPINKILSVAGKSQFQMTFFDQITLRVLIS